MLICSFALRNSMPDMSVQTIHCSKIYMTVQTIHCSKIYMTVQTIHCSNIYNAIVDN